jgi:succinate dehydrogenase/fumarate reductase flavoprotein subunit
MKEYTADVVVIGFGGSGSVAAIEAHDAGASVIVLEKTDEGGGSTRESSGSLRVIAHRDKAVSHFHELTKGATPIPVLQTFTDGVLKLGEWVKAHGGELVESKRSDHRDTFPMVAQTTCFPNVKDADGVGGRVRVKPVNGEGGGASLWKVLEANIRSRKIQVLYNTPGQRLVRDPADRIVGVKATSPEGEVTIKVKRAVILTCGGFNYNPEMQRQFFGYDIPALSPPGRNTGDGIKMAMSVGADLWHMKSVACGFGYKIPGYEAAFHAKFLGKSFVIVDQKGRRFMDETGVESHSGLLATGVTDPIEGQHYRLPGFLIFDGKMRTAGPIVSNRKSSYNQRFPWSKDNGDELKKGWIKTAPTLAKLAEQFDLPAKALEATVKRFNEGIDKGADEFERKADLMLKIEPPYYGIPIWPALLNTQGGPRRNEQAQIIDVYGDPIPRLYSAGELGSIWGSLYPGAGNVCECLVFGQIAGRNAAAEKPVG